MSELEGAWRALEGEARPEIGWHARTVHRDAPCVVRAALRQPDGGRALLFEVAASSIPAGLTYPDCAGFVLAPEPMQPGPGGRVRLALQERGSGYAEPFALMASDLARRVSRSADEPKSVAALLARLEVWQRFMSRFGTGRLSDEARVGLAAELLFLESSVMPRLPCHRALGSWLGPTGAPQDFRFPGCLVEIKATLSSTPAYFRVSSLAQLDGDAGLPLYLFHLALTAGAADGRSLPAIVDDLRRQVAASRSGSEDVLETLLLEAGYLDAHAPGYLTPTYAVRSVRAFRVEESFPRLTPGGVPAGVLAATYDVSLAACEQWRTEISECLELIGTLNV